MNKDKDVPHIKEYVKKVANGFINSKLTEESLRLIEEAKILTDDQIINSPPRNKEGQSQIELLKNGDIKVLVVNEDGLDSFISIPGDDRKISISDMSSYKEKVKPKKAKPKKLSTKNITLKHSILMQTEEWFKGTPLWIVTPEDMFDYKNNHYFHPAIITFKEYEDECIACDNPLSEKEKEQAKELIDKWNKDKVEIVKYIIKLDEKYNIQENENNVNEFKKALMQLHAPYCNYHMKWEHIELRRIAQNYPKNLFTTDVSETEKNIILPKDETIKVEPLSLSTKGEWRISWALQGMIDKTDGKGNIKHKEESIIINPITGEEKNLILPRFYILDDSIIKFSSIRGKPRVHSTTKKRTMQVLDKMSEKMYPIKLYNFNKTFELEKKLPLVDVAKYSLRKDIIEELNKLESNTGMKIKIDEDEKGLYLPFARVLIPHPVFYYMLTDKYIYEDSDLLSKIDTINSNIGVTGYYFLTYLGYIRHIKKKKNQPLKHDIGLKLLTQKIRLESYVIKRKWSDLEDKLNELFLLAYNIGRIKNKKIIKDSKKLNEDTIISIYLNEEDNPPLPIGLFD